MTAEERRVIEALQAHTGGLIVTDQDVTNAQLQLKETLETTPTRSPWPPMMLAAAAVVALVVGIVGFQTLGEDDKTGGGPAEQTTEPDWDFPSLTGPAPTADQVVGVWRVDGSSEQLRFGNDGSFALTDTGQLYTSPMLTGEYTFDDGLITVTLDSGECAGATFAMRASLPDPGTNPGYMVTGYTLVEKTQCGPVSFAGTEGALQHALPMNESELRSIVEDQSPDARWKPATPALVQPGLWVAVGGGHVLELAPGGSYVVAAGAGEVVDRGQWTVTDTRQLQLVSGSDSPNCDAGDRLVLGQLAISPHGWDFIRGTTEQNKCGGAWTHTAWFLFPHTGTED